jgi:hypothetical protein
MNRQYHPKLPEIADFAELFSFWPNYQVLRPEFDEVDRICLDRLLLIRERMLDLGLADRPVLDLGGGSGYFSWALYVTTASSVDLVEDERARGFGYNEASFTGELRARIERLGLDNLRVSNASIEEFLAAQAGHGQWDVTLCLSVLHHFLTGYGDRRDVGRIAYAELLDIFRRIGEVTARALYIEVDSERIANYESFLSDLQGEGRFATSSVIGTSPSSIGVPRNVIEFLK